MKPIAWLIIHGLSIGGPTAVFILFSFIRQLNTSLLHMLLTPGAQGQANGLATRCFMRCALAADLFCPAHPGHWGLRVGVVRYV